MPIASDITTAPTISIDSIGTTTVDVDLSNYGDTETTDVVIMLRNRSNVTDQSYSTSVNRNKAGDGTGVFTVSGVDQASTWEIIGIPQNAAGEIGPSSKPIIFAPGEGAVLNPADPSTRFTLRDALLFLKTKLEAIIWPGSANTVFKEVAIGTHMYDDQMSLVNAPFAMISIGDSVISSHGGGEEPIFERAQVVIGVLVITEGEAFGKAALIGDRVDAVSDTGVGITEISPVLKDALRKGGQSDSFRFTFANQSRPRPRSIQHPGIQLTEFLYQVEIAESMLSNEPEAF